jgi:hypothetical protein
MATVKFEVPPLDTVMGSVGVIVHIAAGNALASHVTFISPLYASDEARVTVLDALLPGTALRLGATDKE